MDEYLKRKVQESYVERLVRRSLFELDENGSYVFTDEREDVGEEDVGELVVGDATGAFDVGLSVTGLLEGSSVGALVTGFNVGSSVGILVVGNRVGSSVFVTTGTDSTVITSSNIPKNKSSYAAGSESSPKLSS